MGLTSNLELYLNVRHVTGDQFVVDIELHNVAGEILQRVTADRSDELLTIDEQTRTQLRALSLNPDAYGAMLGKLLFRSSKLRNGFTQALTRSRASMTPTLLHVRLRLFPEAARLHDLWWETMHGPLEGDEHRLAALQNVIFSRALIEGESYELKARTRHELRALIAIARPYDYAAWGLTAIDGPIEEARMRGALQHLTQTHSITVVRATPSHLATGLQKRPDILYLMAHGVLQGEEGHPAEPTLYFEGDQGQVVPFAARELTQLIERMDEKPRLVILASCFSAGDSDDDQRSVDAQREQSLLGALGPRLIAAGVPVVIGARGHFSIESAHLFLETFFQELARDGLVDRAVAAARGKLMVHKRHDWWKLVLMLRRRDSRLWWEPEARLTADHLRRLLWKQHDLSPESLELLAGAFNACPGIAHTPLDLVTSFDDLVFNIHRYDGDKPAFVALEEALNTALPPQNTTWGEAAELWALLKSVRLPSSECQWLARGCGRLDWQPPPATDIPQVVSLARALRELPFPQTGGWHPLIRFVELMLQQYGVREDVQAVQEALVAWCGRLREGFGLATTSVMNAPVGQRRSYLLVQIMRTDSNAGKLIPEEALPKTPLRVDAWVFHEGDRPDQRYRLPLPPDLPEAGCTLDELCTAFSSLVEVAIEQSPGFRLAIELLLPLELMLFAFDRLELSSGYSRFDDEDDPKPVLGELYSVTIRALERFVGPFSKKLGPPWLAKWDDITDAAVLVPRLCWVTSKDESTTKALNAHLISREEVAGIAQTISAAELRLTDPKRPFALIDVALQHGIPGMLIVREPCNSPDMAKAALLKHLQKCPFSKLPDEVLAFRIDPEHLDDEHYVGRSLTLLWDDPRRCPPPPFEQPL